MKNLLYSLILELTVNNATTLPISTGYQTYSLFLNIISQVDPVLAARMHEESNNYRPFTISSLRGPIEQGRICSCNLDNSVGCESRCSTVGRSGKPCAHVSWRAA